jgi:hypothetical protein
MVQQQVGEFASIDPATRTQNARVQETGASPKNSLNPRHDLQHIQRPTPPHLGKNPPTFPGLDGADLARRRRRVAISVTRNFPQQISNNVTKPRIVMRARTSHHAVLPPLGSAKVPALRVCGTSRFAKISLARIAARKRHHIGRADRSLPRAGTRPSVPPSPSLRQRKAQGSFLAVAALARRKALTARGAVSSRRKTTRAVITRTIIDGTTHMRESPMFATACRRRS